MTIDQKALIEKVTAEIIRSGAILRPSELATSIEDVIEHHFRALPAPDHAGLARKIRQLANMDTLPNGDAPRKLLREAATALSAASPSPYGVEAKITDAMLLAGCKVLHPSIFSTGLEPRPSDGPATRAVIVEDINKVRSILTAALSLTKDQSNG